MPASATSSKSSLLSDICGYRAHGALLQVVPRWLNRTPVGAGRARECHNLKILVAL